MGFFSVNMLNRRKLMIDNNAEYIARCADKLKRAGIPNEVHTKRLRSTIDMRMDVGAYRVDVSTYMRLNEPYGDNPQRYGYTYTIFVPRKRLLDARILLGI